MSRTILVEKVYPHPRENVWAALTKPRALAEWLMPNNFQAQVGCGFRFQVDPSAGFDGIYDCQVTRLEELAELGYSLAGKGLKQPTRVLWTLADKAGGTHLRLTHGGFEGVGGWLASRRLQTGWVRMTGNLLPLVLGNIREGVFTPGAIPLHQRAYKAGKVRADDLELG